MAWEDADAALAAAPPPPPAPRGAGAGDGAGGGAGAGGGDSELPAYLQDADVGEIGEEDMAFLNDPPPGRVAAAGDFGAIGGDEGDVLRNEDITRIKRALLNEKTSPELLPYQEELVDELIAATAHQSSVIEDARSTVAEAFAASLYQMEIDRVNFLVASYLRTRLFKIQKYAVYLLSNADMYARLSEREKEFARGYVDSLEQHFRKSFLDAIPEKYRSLTDQFARSSMIRSPNADTHVFCRVMEDTGGHVLEDDGSGDPLALEVGNAFVVKYSSVRDLVESGKVELC